MNKVPELGAEIEIETREGSRSGKVEITEPLTDEGDYEPVALVEFENGSKLWIPHEELVRDE